MWPTYTGTRAVEHALLSSLAARALCIHRVRRIAAHIVVTCIASITLLLYMFTIVSYSTLLVAIIWVLSSNDLLVPYYSVYDTRKTRDHSASAAVITASAPYVEDGVLLIFRIIITSRFYPVFRSSAKCAATLAIDLWTSTGTRSVEALAIDTFHERRRLTMANNSVVPHHCRRMRATLFTRPPAVGGWTSTMVRLCSCTRRTPPRTFRLRISLVFLTFVHDTITLSVLIYYPLPPRRSFYQLLPILRGKLLPT